MAGAGGAWDEEREPLWSREMELEPRRPPPLPGKTQRATMQAQGSMRARSSSLDLGTPMPDTPRNHPPRPPNSALIYSNVGELRAHLTPRKACRGEGAGRPPPHPDGTPLPPPLPKKQLQRAESLPEPGPSQHNRSDSTTWSSSTPQPHLQREEGAPSSIPSPDRPSWAHKKLLTKSQSLGEPAAWSSLQKSPSPIPAALTFGAADGELGKLLQLLDSPDGVCRVVLGCQEAALARLSARIQEELMGPEERQQRLQAELAGKSWAALSILERAPCCESRDAWYFPVGFSLEQAQVVCAAKVPKPCCTSLGLQSSLGVHCSIQRVIGRFTDRLPWELVLPGSPGEQSRSLPGEEPAHPATHPVLQVLICPEVPYQTLADFVKGSHGLHRTCPGHYERLACLLLLQSQQGKKASLGLSLPRLLISSFYKLKDKQRPYSTSQEQDWTEGLAAPPSLVADELNVGMLIYQLLHVDISLESALGFRSNRLPEIPSLSIYSTGLKRLAMLLLHRDPCKRVSVEQAKSILQVLLWGPRQELFARAKKTLTLLRSWVEVKRALLLLRFVENSAGAVGSPGLEEWLCCQYFKEVTEHTLYQVTQALYTP
ncbi:protein PEAK3 isoform X2 [Lathamus discolor]|uniref:protein PEAK3 isoform X2 n=1 Tax=Lathamus discolor TaxID=678569 RepID=UPI0032B80D3F